MDLRLENVTSQKSLTFIEQLHAIASQPCITENRPYLVGVTEAEKIAILTRPPCKMWKCKPCAARNARRWLARIINHINLYPDANWRFFTLTAHEKWRGREASTKNLRQGWKKLYNRLKRRWGSMFYLKVWESHADGSFHLHGFINIRIKKSFLKKHARSCGMGYQVDIQGVRNAGQAAGYVAKYFLKSEVIGEYPKGLRRIEASQNWTKLPELHAETLLTWFVQQTREGQLNRALSFYQRGFEIEDISVPSGSENFYEWFTPSDEEV